MTFLNAFPHLPKADTSIQLSYADKNSVRNKLGDDKRLDFFLSNRLVIFYKETSQNNYGISLLVDCPDPLKTLVNKQKIIC